MAILEAGHGFGCDTSHVDDRTENKEIFLTVHERTADTAAGIEAVVVVKDRGVDCECFRGCIGCIVVALHGHERHSLYRIGEGKSDTHVVDGFFGEGSEVDCVVKILDYVGVDIFKGLLRDGGKDVLRLGQIGDCQSFRCVGRIISFGEFLDKQIVEESAEHECLALDLLLELMVAGRSVDVGENRIGHGADKFVELRVVCVACGLLDHLLCVGRFVAGKQYGGDVFLWTVDERRYIGVGQEVTGQI